ncbi:septal ring lytic transglycosylase RlpA family protein [Micromonospora sp. WMMD1082]|uniref:septal ring lytic transglycosylase RlpA family protein n=1 Tax=Micromonospora sp. WMMD1082 TaxID=3016104 RepID=UPI0024178002|nr:septal ring lytic transglycosylase RlpA family protein [Micromonospora sp. WMMD1082]MDG4794813.1 septal ring lytic transglycosylase RlpA family protein [Micromonospora sp. WMMD1082]
MAGRHSRTRRITSPAALTASAVVAVALAVGGTVGAVRLTAGPEPVRPAAIDLSPTIAASDLPTGAPTESPSASATPSPTASATPSPTASRTAQAPSRSKERTASPTPKPTATKTTARPVVDTGSCGASFYWQGQMTANGETFNPEQLTAAHKTLPFNTKVRVTNPSNGKSVTVRINDRGPFIDGRCLDLSRAAFAEIASLDLGHIEVRYEVLG